MSEKRETITVFIVDDHPLMRDALEAAIESEADMEVIGQAVNGEEALALIPTMQPDVIVMDLLMPKLDGWKTIAALKERQVQTPILVLSSTVDEDKILEAIRRGASGYIPKVSRRDELIDAIRTVEKGEMYLSPSFASTLVFNVGQPTSPSEQQIDSPLSLTPKQEEVLDLLGQGFTDDEIAQSLHISRSTLRVHIHHMVRKLGFEHRRELIVHAVCQHLERGE